MVIDSPKPKVSTRTGGGVQLRQSEIESALPLDQTQHNVKLKIGMQAEEFLGQQKRCQVHRLEAQVADLVSPARSHLRPPLELRHVASAPAGAGSWHERLVDATNLDYRDVQ